MTTEIAIEENFELLSELEPIQVKLTELFVNPNNPRIMGKKKRETVTDDRIMESKVQESVMEDMKREGLNDIIEKIKKMGFLPIDRIVVRKLNNQQDKYLVLEGNRRTSALKILHEEHEKSIYTLNEEFLNSIIEFPVLLYKGDDDHIEWILQGIRHINGIKEWGPLQQAMFLVEMQNQKHLSPTDLHKMTGLGRNTIANKIRSYKGWLNAQTVYDGDVEEVHYSLFSEAIFARPKIREWLNWDDITGEFTNEDDFALLLNWFLGDVNDKRRFTRALDVRDVMSKLLLSGNKDLKDKFFNEDEYSVEEVKYDLNKKELDRSEQQNKLDIGARIEELQKVNSNVSTLPIPTIVKDKRALQNFISHLAQLIQNATFQKVLLQKYLDEES